MASLVSSLPEDVGLLMLATASHDAVAGGPGDDSLAGRGGRDDLAGGKGDDVLGANGREFSPAATAAMSSSIATPPRRVAAT